MRRVVWAGLVAAGLLWPTMAGAECAWVLWSRSFHLQGGLTGWATSSAHGSRAECLSEAHRVATSIGGPSAKLTNTGSLAITGPSSYAWECFPDTMRPQ